MQISLFDAALSDGCVQAFMKAYNGAPWNSHWTSETADRYLKEIAANPRFVGFVVIEGGEVAGAAFCREKTWWTNDELYVEEFFLSPEHQRKGFGKALLAHIEDYIRQRGLAGFTLLTDRFMPSVDFYEKNGFAKGEHVVFMYKVVQ